MLPKQWCTWPISLAIDSHAYAPETQFLRCQAGMELRPQIDMRTLYSKGESVPKHVFSPALRISLIFHKRIVGHRGWMC